LLQQHRLKLARVGRKEAVIRIVITFKVESSKTLD